MSSKSQPCFPTKLLSSILWENLAFLSQRNFSFYPQSGQVQWFPWVPLATFDAENWDSELAPQKLNPF